ncbi:MAG TPA: SH3 domain-containing protein, partial [Brevundimonas sp.]|nr:SH3 domain-containing protein [Brevundimonas sp.]
MSKMFKAGLAATAMFAALGSAAVPMSAAAMPQANGVTNCDAPGGRQQAGAAI